MWDWLQLLLVPVLIGAAAYWFRETEREIQQKRADERAESERKKAEKHAASERKKAEKHAETEQAIAEDNRQEVALQTYLDRMAELLLKKDTHENADYEPVHAVSQPRSVASHIKIQTLEFGYLSCFQ